MKKAVPLILRSLRIWLCFVPVAVLNGGLREYVWDRILGAQWALPVSGIVLSGCIFLITWFLLPRMGKTCTSGDCRMMGIFWFSLTAVFEFVSGSMGGHTWGELLGAYDPSTGNLWLLVVASALLSPAIVRAKRSDRFVSR